MTRGVLELPTGRFLITDHALRRAVEMKLEPDTIRRALDNPEQTARSKKYPGCMNFMAGDIIAAVQMAEHPHVVKTFLWRYVEGWQNGVPAGSDRTSCPPKTYPHKPPAPPHPGERDN